MTTQQFQENLTKFRDARDFKKTKTVPFLASATTWMIYDSKYTPFEAYYDTKIMKEITLEFAKRYDFDGYQYNAAVYNFPFTDALNGGPGKGTYVLGENGMNVVDHDYISHDEYAEYAANPLLFMRKAFARKYPNLTTPMFAKAAAEVFKFSQYQAGADNIFRDEIQRPLMTTMKASCLSPMELLNSALSGIKNISIDVRRNKEELKVYLDASWNNMNLPGLQGALAGDQSDYVCNIYCSMLLHSLLSVKQFDELYWSYLKQMYSMVQEAGKTVYVFAESEMMRFCEFFQDFPKGLIIMHLEMDDIFEVRKKLPNICLAGGFPSDTLKYGTPQECIDTAKRIIDKMGAGYILSTTKIAAYRNDVKRENLLALSEFVRNYNI